MTFNAFLTALDQTLDEAPESPSDPGAPPPRPIPHAIYDSCCREATAPDQVLIGLGLWQQGGRPVEHRGVCLNNKGIADRFGAACRYATVTDLVLDPPEPLCRHWERLTADDRGPGELLRRFTLIVEDTGPDSCFALLCWLARASGVDLEELRTGQGRSWVQAVRQWESTGMVADPATSWAALLSTLGHSQLQVAAVPAHDAARHPLDVSRGWREALRLTLYLLRREVHPDSVPPLWGQPDYVRARAFLEVERQEYLQSLGQATCLQLWVPLAGTGGPRRLLVDAYFAVETWPSGARKLFVRTDREHTHLRQGFALMGLYRPGERGTGGDLTISVNPWTGIDLQLLWAELERLETERWQGRRPCDRPRPSASYPAGAGYNQPWWDDGGRYTLLGGPKALPDWPAGSRLEWPEVLEAAWRCYSPLSDLRIHDLLGQRDCPLSECRREPIQTPGGTVTKQLAAMRWLPDATCPQALFSTPTTLRALAALIARADLGQCLTLAGLPAEQDLELVPLSGGFGILHAGGVLLFDDWRSETLPVDELRQEVQRCVALLGVLREVEGHLAVHRPAPEATARPWRSIGVLADLAAQRTHLARARDENASASVSPEVRRFRTQLSAWWGIDQAADALQRRLTQMEDAIRTTSTLRTQGLVQILSVYGLPFFISGGVLNLVGPWLDTLAGKGEVTLMKLGLYLGLAATLIAGIRLVQWLWVRAAARLPKASEPRPAPEPPAPEA